LSGLRIGVNVTPPSEQNNLSVQGGSAMRYYVMRNSGHSNIV
jgi:hypothetical protein